LDEVNEAKTAVAAVIGRKFFGYELWRRAGAEVRCAYRSSAAPVTVGPYPDLGVDHFP
jgi:hypothetical protein